MIKTNYALALLIAATSMFSCCSHSIKHQEIIDELKELRSTEYRFKENVSTQAQALLSHIDQKNLINNEKKLIIKIQKTMLLGLLKSIPMVMLTEERAPKTYAFIAKLISKFDVPMPIIFLPKDENYLNAFSSSMLQSASCIILGEKFIKTTSEKEFEFVLAHEISHIKCNHSIKQLTNRIANKFLLGYLIKKLTGASLFNTFIGTMLAGTILIDLPISRMHEREADRTAAQVVGPDGGISFFQKSNEKYTLDIEADFNYINDELQKKFPEGAISLKIQAKIIKLFAQFKEFLRPYLSKHPTFDERIKLLQKLRN